MPPSSKWTASLARHVRVHATVYVRPAVRPMAGNWLRMGGRFLVLAVGVFALGWLARLLTAGMADDAGLGRTRALLGLLAMNAWCGHKLVLGYVAGPSVSPVCASLAHVFPSRARLLVAHDLLNYLLAARYTVGISLAAWVFSLGFGLSAERTVLLVVAGVSLVLLEGTLSCIGCAFRHAHMRKGFAVFCTVFLLAAAVSIADAPAFLSRALFQRAFVALVAQAPGTSVSFEAAVICINLLLLLLVLAVVARRAGVEELLQAQTGFHSRVLGALSRATGTLCAGPGARAAHRWNIVRHGFLSVFANRSLLVSLFVLAALTGTLACLAGHSGEPAYRASILLLMVGIPSVKYGGAVIDEVLRMSWLVKTANAPVQRFHGLYVTGTVLGLMVLMAPMLVLLGLAVVYLQEFSPIWLVYVAVDSAWLVCIVIPLSVAWGMFTRALLLQRFPAQGDSQALGALMPDVVYCLAVMTPCAMVLNALEQSLGRVSPAAWLYLVLYACVIAAWITAFFGCISTRLAQRQTSEG